MNAYSAFLQPLSMPQRISAKSTLNSLKEVSHPHICRVIEVLDSPSGLSVRCEPEGSSVLQLHQAQSSSWGDEDLTRQFLGIVAGLSKTQSKVSTRQGIAHGQLMLEALYLDGEGKIKVIGFGKLSGRPENCPCPCPQLSPVYSSPEIKEGQPFNAYKADLFALGVCFLQLGSQRILRDPETLEALVDLANRTGPKLSPLLKLVFKPEEERADCLQFKDQSGYCERCWNNIDQGQPLCGVCPKAYPKVKEVNPLNKPAGRGVEQPPPIPTVVQSSVPQRKLRVNTSPEPPKCRKCQRILKKINEKEVCRLCLIKEKVPDDPPARPSVAISAAPAVIPSAPPAKIENRPFVAPPQPGVIPKVAQKPMPTGFVPGAPKVGQSFGANPPAIGAVPLQGLPPGGAPVPGKPKSVSFAREPEARPPAPFPNLGQQEATRLGEGYCQACGGQLPRNPRWNQEFAEGYDDFCSEKCVEKYMTFMSEVQVPEEISCLECAKPGSSEWIKLPCNEAHRFCSNECASSFAKRTMGPQMDMTLVICPKCKAPVPQDLIRQWKGVQSNNPGVIQPLH